MVRAHGRRAGVSSVGDMEVGNSINFPSGLEILSGGDEYVSDTGTGVRIMSGPFSNGVLDIYDNWQDETVAEMRNDRDELTFLQAIGGQSQTAQPGSASSPVLVMGNSGAGFFVNSSGEVVVVDEAGNTTTIS